MEFRTLMRAAGDSIFEDLGREALKTAVNTLIEEGIEASVEIWKKRRLKIQEELLDERDFQSEESAREEGSERKDYPGGDDPAEADRDEPDSGDEEDRAAAHAAGRCGDRRMEIEPLGAYAARRSSSED